MATAMRARRTAARDGRTSLARADRSGLVGEDLAGVEDAVRIERVLDPALRFDERRRLFEREEALLREADAVLARNRPAQAHGGPHDVGERGLDLRAVVARLE